MNSSISSKRAQLYRELSQRQNIPDVAWIGFMVDLLHVVHTGKTLTHASYAYDDQTGLLQEDLESTPCEIPASSIRSAVHDAYISGYQRLSDMMQHLLPSQYASITNVLSETSHWDLSSPGLTMALLHSCGQPLCVLQEQVKRQWGSSNCWPDEHDVD